ncbi:hypothetical protein [Mycolicibacterium tusciae]|uniref:Uncharacterized protein n=1 Tax=Mycolicibacterium tusciae TaxID=75922 RepID=A0A1X0JXZ4_9MYCO|nr:hypothetical protein [Mycolicibacterium tusciae]ORB67682.1 hypothetical protein BST47_04175 [Mycolicibacterium tusciae]
MEHHPHPPLTELPEHWQEHIKHLRRDRAKLRRLETITDLPPFWQQKIKKLQSEAKQLRQERNALRAELAARNG